MQDPKVVKQYVDYNEYPLYFSNAIWANKFESEIPECQETG